MVVDVPWSLRGCVQSPEPAAALGVWDHDPAAAPTTSDADAVPSEETWLRGRDWAEADPGTLERSRRASQCWSRVVRKPLTLDRHVILDLCVAAPDQRSGALERHIVARSDRKQPWIGPAAYRLARALRWGDLWPSVYHRNAKVTAWR